jgi:Carboxypeptidase regulatory-like domain
MMFNAVDRTAGTTTDQPDTGFAATYYPGTHDPRSAMNIQVGAGKPLTNMDIRLVRTRTVRVRGRVANAGTNPMSRAMIMLAPRDSAFMGFGQNASTTRGADGKFEIRGVAPGAYYLIAHVMDGNSRQSARVPVDVGSTDVDGLEISVSPGQEVTGILRIEGQGEVSPSSVRIMLQPTEFSPMMGGSPPAVVKDDGSFSLRDVQPDHSYRVMVMGPQNQFYVKSVLVGQQEAKDGEITIPASTAPPLSVVVSTAGGQVTGTLKAEADASTQGATIVLVPSGNRNRSDLYKMATPDQYGKFTLASIAPGEYKLFAWDNVETGQWMDPDFLQVHENKGKSITIRENAKESIDVELLKNTNPGETAAR